MKGGRDRRRETQERKNKNEKNEAQNEVVKEEIKRNSRN
jgi:hypothetical protein